MITISHMTIKEATELWVKEFNAIDQGMIDELMSHNPDDWTEVTKPLIGNRVGLFNIPPEDVCGNEYDGECWFGEIRKFLDGGDYLVELDDGTNVRVEADNVEVQYYDELPMWGTMWSFHDGCDTHWLEEEDGIKIMSECGFRIYESEKYGYFFGIDGAGYDFYEDHWIPLYKKRGFQWHDPKAEHESQMRMKGYKKGKLGIVEYWFDGDRAVEPVMA